MSLNVHIYNMHAWCMPHINVYLWKIWYTNRIYMS